MIEFKEIELDDKEIFDECLAQDNIATSDVNFTNCFMWRHARLTEFALVQQNLILRHSFANGNQLYFYPIGCKDKKSSVLCLISEFKNVYFHALSAQQKSELESFDFGFTFEQKRDDFDYIYSVPELITLAGRKYHKKKNHLNAFLQEFGNFKFENLSAQNIEEVKAANNAWFEANPNKNENLKFENLGINDALNNFEYLGLKGGAIRINNKIAAFSFGEKLSANIDGKSVCVMHIEKANAQFRGIYQAINQQNLEHCFSDCEFVNREQDLGIEGLRKAKLSYQPAMLLEKFDAKILV